MRSRTCKVSICSGLIEIRQAIRDLDWSRFYLAAMRKEQVISGQFLQWSAPQH
jgi:hypothetical protein